MKKETKKIESQTPVPVESSVEALQGRIAHLEMGNVYLEKLNALVQMQEKLQIKSKCK
ncbi:hypothetical protein HNP81_004770 [Peribacillus huizhouensis]|uniref:Transposase n=1 Tax=Peribacillus huizhouensis TaxID=1501239 RepID=A0ABR6CWK6_9BACI|nr:hypothetical protein [Peribacillus huizhouensis]